MELGLTYTLQAQKLQLRAAMRHKRHMMAVDHANAFKTLADIFLSCLSLKDECVIASYQPFRDEMDPRILVDALRGHGHQIALPVIIGKKKPLIFRLHKQEDKLIQNVMGIWEPMATAPLVDPDIVLVPLLAFDKNRNRLGYGGGFYDRTIADLRTRKPTLAIGIAYNYQEVADVPVGANDIPLDKIVTEINVF